MCCKPFPSLTTFGTVACSKAFVQQCIDLFRPAMKEKAKKVCGGTLTRLMHMHTHVHTSGIDTHRPNHDMCCHLHLLIANVCFCLSTPLSLSVCLSVCHPRQDLVSNQKFLLQASSPPDHHPQSAASLPEERGKEGRREERRKRAAGMGATSSKQGAHGREKRTQRVKGGKGRARGSKEEEEWEERTLSFMSTVEVCVCVCVCLCACACTL